MTKKIVKISCVALMMSAGILSACSSWPMVRQNASADSYKETEVQPTASTVAGERSPQDVALKSGGKRGEDLTKSTPPSSKKSALAILEAEKKEAAAKAAKEKAAAKQKAEAKKKAAKAAPKKPKETPKPVKAPQKKEQVAAPKAAAAAVVPTVSVDTKAIDAKKQELEKLQKELEAQKKELEKIQAKLAAEEKARAEAADSKKQMTEKEEIEVKIEEEVRQVPSVSKRAKSVYADTVEDWTAYEGATLRGLLQEWGDIAGWRVVWNMDRDYVLEAGAVFRGRFIDVTSALLRSFARARPAPLGTFYRGNKVLVISTREDENAD